MRGLVKDRACPRALLLRLLGVAGARVVAVRRLPARLAHRFGARPYPGGLLVRPILDALRLTIGDLLRNQHRDLLDRHRQRTEFRARTNVRGIPGRRDIEKLFQTSDRPNNAPASFTDLVIAATGDHADIECGTHDELMARRGAYAKLYELQFEDEPPEIEA